MTDLFIASDVVTAVGVTLVNFLWQGALVGAITAGLLVACSRATARTRYAIACLGLLAMTIAPLVTFALVWNTPAPALASHTATSLTPLADALTGTAAALNPTMWLPSVVWLWACGVMALTMRLVYGWWSTERMRRHDVRAVPDALEATVERLAAGLGLQRRVGMVESPWIDVPTVIGWIRPTLLLPIGALTGLSSQQIEAVLAHELAHIRRHDYLVNGLQNVVETLFFYHPAVWWLSHRVRVEREHCCDDVAVQTCGNAAAYVRALATLEEARPRQVPLALAATDGPLLSRIRRLMGSPAERRQPSISIAACVAIVMAVIVFAGNQASASLAGATTQEAPQQVTPDAAHDFAQVLRASGSMLAPRKIVDADPIYPQAARDAGVEGSVVLEITIDTDGAVEKIRVLRSIPALDQAAINAVRQWRYAPTVVDNVPTPVTTTVRVNFRQTPAVVRAARAEANREHAASSSTLSVIRDGQPVRVGGDIREPRKIRDVPPVYPKIAQAFNVSGTVIVEAVIDTNGDVVDVNVVRSVPMLDQAAIDAVSQWKYAPVTLNGAAVSVLLNVAVTFRSN